MDNLWIDNTGVQPEEFEPGCALLFRGGALVIAKEDRTYDWEHLGFHSDIIAWMPKRDIRTVLRSNYPDVKEKNHEVD